MLKVYALKDIKGNLFNAPFFVKSTAEAMRAFYRAYITEDTPVHMFPSDFALYELGSFDEEEGEFTLFGIPVRIAVADEFDDMDNEKPF